MCLSAAARHDEIGEFAQGIGARSEAGQMVGRLAGKHRRMCPRPLGAECCDHRGLAGRGILAGGLAGFLGGALGIEQIVGDLERGAEVAAVGGEQMALRRRGTPEDGARPRR